jgi:hypothetical protein
MNVMVLAYLIAIAVSLGVGVPVLVRSWHHRDGRLALLGAVVTFDGLEWLAWALAVFTSASGTPLGDALGIASRAGIAASTLCMIAFTRLAFRPDGDGPLVVAWLLVGALLGGFLGGGLSGDWVGVRTDLAWLWLEQFAIALAYGWGALEALRYHLMMRRRVAHGLVEPMVSNRFLMGGRRGISRSAARCQTVALAAASTRRAYQAGGKTAKKKATSATTTNAAFSTSMLETAP